MSFKHLESGNELAGIHCVVCDINSGGPRHASGFTQSLRTLGAGVTMVDLGKNSPPNRLLNAIQVTAETHTRVVVIFGGGLVADTHPNNTNSALRLAKKHGMPALMIQPPKYLQLIKGDFIPVRDRPRNLAPYILAALNIKI